jgi:hypothetical protein
MGELAGLRQGLVDLLVGAVTVAEILTEVKGKLIAGPARDARRPSDRRAAAPSSSVTGGISAAAERPGSHVFTAPGAGRCVSRAFGRALGCRLPRQPTCRACTSTIFATPRGVVDRRPRDAQGGRHARGAHLGQLDPGPLRPPDDPPAGRGGPVLSSKGLDYGARQHGRKPQDARSPG